MKARKREKTRRNEGKRGPDITTTEPRVAATERENGVAATAGGRHFYHVGFLRDAHRPTSERPVNLFYRGETQSSRIHTFYLSLLLLSVYVSFLRFEGDRRVKIPRIVRYSVL